MEVTGIDAGQVERGPARAGGLDWRAVDLDLADPGRGVARHHPQCGPAGQAAAAERARDHHPSSLDREDAVDPEPDGRCRGAVSARLALGLEAGGKRLERRQ